MNNLFSIRRKNDAVNGRIIWSQDQIDYIIQDYNNFHSTTRIASQFNVSRETIRGLLRKQKVHVLTLSELKILDFPRNSDFFEVIDTPQKAYWLGFLYADGYISTKNEIRINLKKEDEEHLRKFLRAIQATNHTIKYSIKKDGNKIYEQAYCSIRDTKMVRDLADKGCINKKSLVLSFPTTDKLPISLYSHFIRGYFDGDGSINWTQCGRAKTPNYRISFVGTKDILIHIRDILRKNNLSLENKGNYYCLSICGNKQLERILAYLYKDSMNEIELNRKRIIYDNFLLQRIGGEPINIGCK